MCKRVVPDGSVPEFGKIRGELAPRPVALCVQKLGAHPYPVHVEIDASLAMIYTGITDEEKHQEMKKL
jgi:hypothetical protein